MGAACAIKINPFQKDIWLINKGDIPKTVTIISILSLYTEGDTAEFMGHRVSVISILSLYTEGDY